MKLVKKPDRIWIAERRGTAVFARGGTPRAPGVPKAKELRTEAAARAFLESERDARLADGFEMVDADAGLDAPFTIDGARAEAWKPPAKLAYMEDLIRTHVLGGFTDADDMERVIDDALSLSRVVPGKMKKHLEDLAIDERQALSKRAAPVPCVNDGIDAAFAELSARGIVALQNAGNTQSEGWEDVNFEVARRLARGEPRPVGGCFYHFQDLERAVRGAGLMLCFAAFGHAPRGADYHDERTGNTDGATEAIGRTIVEVLEKHGVHTAWDGTVRTRIRILPFEWFRRPMR